VASSNHFHEAFIAFQAHCGPVVKRGAYCGLVVKRGAGTECGSCAESGLYVPILRAVARQGFEVAGVAWGERPFP
jgi:hypothetical protein